MSKMCFFSWQMTACVCCESKAYSESVFSQFRYVAYVNAYNNYCVVCYCDTQQIVLRNLCGGYHLEHMLSVLEQNPVYFFYTQIFGNQTQKISWAALKSPSNITVVSKPVNVSES